jgi:hypothetical protein
MHPLLAWWAALYALSMVARYEPVGWSNMIDVDRSTYAVSIECLLDVALEAVPEVVADSLIFFSEPSSERERVRRMRLEKFEQKEYKTFGEIVRLGLDKVRGDSKQDGEKP